MTKTIVSLDDKYTQESGQVMLTALQGVVRLLLDQARRLRFPAAVLHPGHLVGAGWMPLSPAANFNPAVFACLAMCMASAAPALAEPEPSTCHIPERSGLPSEIRGAGAVRFGVPSGRRGTPGVG